MITGTGPSCRFTPTCSQYAGTAIRYHGVFCGSWVTFKRLLRCNPWGRYGWDPVSPEKKRDSWQNALG